MAANLLLAAQSGLIATLVMTILIYLAKAAGFNLDIPYLLGSRFAGVENKGKVYGIGLLLHFVLGAIWGMVYIFFITAMAVRPDWPAGILYGVAHGIFVGAMIGTLSQNHPHIGEGRAIEDPGMFGRNWGVSIPYLILALHLIFGVITMLAYDHFYQFEQIPRM